MRARLRQWVATGTGLDEVEELEGLVDALSETVAENTALEEPLRARVSELEQQLLIGLANRREFLDQV